MSPIKRVILVLVGLLLIVGVGYPTLILIPDSTWNTNVWEMFLHLLLGIGISLYFLGAVVWLTIGVLLVHAGVRGKDWNDAN